MLSAIVAMDEAGGIGKDGKIPWYIKEDLKWFKEYTLDKSIIVGPVTAQTLPQPLNRRNVYILHRRGNFSNNEYIQDGQYTFYISSAAKETKEGKVFGRFNINIFQLPKNAIVCGGAKIYQSLIPYCEELYVTKIKGVYECDTFFPFNWSNLAGLFSIHEKVKEFEGGHELIKCSRTKLRTRIIY